MTAIMTGLFAILLVLSVPVGYALIIAAGGAILWSGGTPTVVAVVKLFQPTQSFPPARHSVLHSLRLTHDVRHTGQEAGAIRRRSRWPLSWRHGAGDGCGVNNLWRGLRLSCCGSISTWLNAYSLAEERGISARLCSGRDRLIIDYRKPDPPSIPLILYSTVSNQSIASLFSAGVLPGLMLAVGMMFVCYFSGRLRNFPRLSSKDQLATIRQTFVAALPALAMPFFIIILLRVGIATPTEVSVIAVFYALMVSLFLYRDLTLSRTYHALVNTVVTTGVVMLVITASSLVGHVLITERIPTMVAQWSLDVLSNAVLIILMMNIIMLVIGMFLDLPAAILLLGPTFVAIGQAIGMDPIQLGVMVCINLSIGLYTPPIGTTLFIGAAIARVPIGVVVKELWPFYGVAFIVLLLMSYFPAFTIY